MSMIQCDVDCIYQRNGYCTLEMPSAITNYKGDGCVYCIKVTPRSSDDVIQSRPQTPPSHF